MLGNKDKISDILAHFIAEQSFQKLDSKLVEHIKYSVLDCIGVAIAGIHLMEFPKTIREIVREMGGTKEASVFTLKKKVPALNAAFANGVFAHSLDMDDGHRVAALHPGCVIIPASLAAAEMSGCSGIKLIEGIYVGYETMIRIGMCINPSSLNRGFHTTGTAGSFGAAAACSKIFNLPAETIRGALGIAGIQSCGLLRVNHEDEGSKVKPLTPGRAAMAGLLSAILAERGFTGPLEIFEGTDGFLRAFSDKYDTEILTENLGVRHETLKTYIKFYAACRHCHAPIDAALELRQRLNLRPENIELIEVWTYPAAIRLAGISEVNSPSAARFSIPFSVSLALVRGGAGAYDYTHDAVTDERIRSLARRVKLIPSEKWASLYPIQRGASVRVVTKDGTDVVSEISLPRGEPENPGSPTDIVEKFHENVSRALGHHQSRRICEIILRLEELPNIDQLTVLLRKEIS